MLARLRAQNSVGHQYSCLAPEGPLAILCHGQAVASPAVEGPFLVLLTGSHLGKKGDELSLQTGF